MTSIIKLLKGDNIWYLLSAIAIYLFYTKYTKAAKAREIEKNLSDNNNPTLQLAAMYALRLDNAFRPSGDWHWVNDIIGDGTDEESVFKVAQEMQLNGVSFSLVSTAYKSKFNRDLMTDLSSELSQTELNKFLSYIRV